MSTKNLRVVARKINAIRTDDPDGLLATLQITKRLISESLKADEPVTIMTALNTGVVMASPKDQARTWWSALRLLFRHAAPEKSSLAILADATLAQGKWNALAKKRIPA